LFEHFKECGEIDNVRVIRDNKTGVGKGIGYVSFKTADAVILALKLNKSEVDSRPIRVERCSKKQKKNKKTDGKKPRNNNRTKDYEANKRNANRTRESEDGSSNNNNQSKNKNDTSKYKKKFKSRNPLKSIKTNKRPSTTLKF
jgi:nucleolar protein 12